MVAVRETAELSVTSVMTQDLIPCVSSLVPTAETHKVPFIVPFGPVVNV